MLKSFLVFVLLLIMPAVSAFSAESSPTASVQQKVGQFTELRLLSSAGLEKELTSLKGQPVLVVYWASWCVPCRKFRIKLEAMQESYPELHILGISIDTDLEMAQLYAQKSPFLWRVFWADESIAREIHSVPTTMLVNRDGKKVKTLIGDSTLQRLEHYVQLASKPVR